MQFIKINEEITLSRAIILVVLDGCDYSYLPIILDSCLIIHIENLKKSVSIKNIDT